MVNFGGWDMPVEYSGIVAEHMATRTAAGLFDVSHMGEIEIRGGRALELVQHVTCNDASKLVVGQAQYSGLMTGQGTFVDDLLVHKISDTHYFLCVNAGNQDQDFEHIRAHNRAGAQIENAGERYSQLAIQGPKALGILQRFTAVPLDCDPLLLFHIRRRGWRPLPDRAHRIYGRRRIRGLFCAASLREAVDETLMMRPLGTGMLPCGLGARNTLRLEASMCLYGHEIDDTTTPWEAGLGWICKPGKGEFLGREALVRQKEKGVERTLVGFEMQDRLIARDACTICGDKPVGRVTSGSPAPFLKKNIGMAYVPPALRTPGTEIAVEIRGKQAPARIVAMPFYKRAK